MKALIDNPVARRELRFLRRRWVLVLLVALLAWVPLQWLVRSLWVTGGGALGFWQNMATYVLILMYRPDLLFGFVMVAAMATEARWWRCRDEYAVTRLDARSLASGMIAGPLLLLALLHVAISPVAYHALLGDASLGVRLFDGEEGLVNWMPAQDAVAGMPLHLGWVVMPLAIMEDIFYAVLVLLVAMNQYLLRRDSWNATFVAFAQLSLISIGIAACSFVYYAVTWVVSNDVFVRLMMTPSLDFVVGNLSWFATVLPFQLLLLVLLWKRLVRRLGTEFLDPAGE